MVTRETFGEFIFNPLEPAWPAVDFPGAGNKEFVCFNVKVSQEDFDKKFQEDQKGKQLMEGPVTGVLSSMGLLDQMRKFAKYSSIFTAVDFAGFTEKGILSSLDGV